MQLLKLLKIMIQNSNNVNPIISVILPAYNAEMYLRESIQSILSQTFTRFELLIINDGSTDKTEDIILSYQDPRIRYVKNETNLRLIKTLNKGIDLARGKYIARMDADDISLPNRLQEEFDFMEANPNIGACSSKVYHLRENKIIKGHYYPSSLPAACRFCAIFRTPLSHPASFFRTDVLKSIKYEEDDSALHIEAFVLWGEMALRNIQMAVINKRLLYYRDNELSICHTYSKLQLQNHKKRVSFMLSTLLGIKGVDASVNILFDNSNVYSYRELSEAVKLIDVAYHKYISSFKIKKSEIKDVYITRYIIKRNFVVNLVKRYNGLKRFQASLLLLSIILKRLCHF